MTNAIFNIKRLVKNKYSVLKLLCGLSIQATVLHILISTNLYSYCIKRAVEGNIIAREFARPGIHDVTKLLKFQHVSRRAKGAHIINLRPLDWGLDVVGNTSELSMCIYFGLCACVR